jgi:hypothetical protein
LIDIDAAIAAIDIDIDYCHIDAFHIIFDIVSQ